MSETGTVRSYVVKYCRGQGLDIGCGTDLITEEAIGIDYHRPYNRRQCGATTEADIRGPWERALAQFGPDSVDYVYSSHLLEGYPDIEPVLEAWSYHVKPGGFLVLCLPIEELFAPAFARAPQRYYHTRYQSWTGSEDFVASLPDWFSAHMEVVEASAVIARHSFCVVFRKRDGLPQHAQVSRVWRIEFNPREGDRWEGGDFALVEEMADRSYLPGDVRTYYSRPSGDPEPSLALPSWLEPRIEQELEPGVRVQIGNAGCELSYRHIHAGNAKENVVAILRWAQWAYGLVGDGLVLAPMDFDLIHDVMTGRRLLRWAAAHRVPLVVHRGYRFFFPPDAFEHIREVSGRHPFSAFGNLFAYPFPEVSIAIKHTGAEAWTGAGLAGGLQHGAIEKARAFGFSGVAASREAWETGFG